MSIPLVDLRRQYLTIKPDVDAAIQRVIDNTSFILGDEVAAFEREFARYMGAHEAVGVASGTSALHLALVACGIGAGDEVITSAHTFVATAEAIAHAGARPVFVDIDLRSYTLDPALVEQVITPRTKAILPVHLYGHPADLVALREVAERHDLWLIEDAAQAHGATHASLTCGSAGDLACFSFYPGKNLGAFGDAGAVTGNDPELIERVRKLRDHGRVSKYEHEMVGWGERMDALQAAVLGVKLPHLPAWTEARRRHAAVYSKLLADLPLSLPSESPASHHVYHLYVIRTERRDALLAHLREKGIGAGIHYPVPVHLQHAFCAPGVIPVTLPQTEQAAREVLSLPLFPEMTEQEVEFVADAVREFFQ